jgi:NlpC/P60 family
MSCSEKQVAGLDPASLIGKPYRLGGRGPDAYDCWGLVTACYPWLPDDWGNQEFSVRRVILLIEGQKTDERWEPAGEAHRGAVAIFGMGERASHTGLVWPVSGGARIIHALPKVGVVSHSLPAMERLGMRLKGIYKWRG